MSKRDEILKGTAETFLEVITTGNPRRTLKPDDQVLFIQDHDPVQNGLSADYTESIADVIKKWQTDNGSKPNVIIQSLPKERPFKSLGKKIPKLIASSQVVIGTYGNPGIDVLTAEEKPMHKGFLEPLNKRYHADDFRFYAVAPRPVMSVLELLADKDIINHSRELALNIQTYLQNHIGERYTLETGDTILTTIIPKDNPVIADCYQMTDSYMINFPGGETFFAPTPGTTNGRITMKKGSFYGLTEPVKGEIILKIKDGYVKKVIGSKKDQEIVERIENDLSVDVNRFIAEFAMGVMGEASKLPFEDVLYNRTILEKIHPWHFAYGSSTHIGGKHEADIHKDHSFAYGNIYVGNQKVVHQGKPMKILTGR